ncbi:MAG TPA: NUDIX domain-containing protein, partial [Candidatus Limnocylindria bacterium]|nr:NUDIX domain-containing protein [Candidatus Limnocylindria bacterium]
MSGFPCPRCGRIIRRIPASKARPVSIHCPRCRFMMHDYPRSCAGMIVVKGDAVLMLRRGHRPRRGYLDFPGGFIESGEAIEGAARRELQEETGLVV